MNIDIIISEFLKGKEFYEIKSNRNIQLLSLLFNIVMEVLATAIRL